MKFFKQTKETKRKISFFMALAMIISLLPASPVVKAANTVAADTVVEEVSDCGVYVNLDEASKKYVKLDSVVTGGATGTKEATTASVIIASVNDDIEFTSVSLENSGFQELTSGKTVTLGSISLKKNAEAVTKASVVVREKKVGEGEKANVAVSSSSLLSKDVIAKVSLSATGSSLSEPNKNISGAVISIAGIAKDKNIEVAIVMENVVDSTSDVNVTFNGNYDGTVIKAKLGGELVIDSSSNKTTATVPGNSEIDLTIEPDSTDKEFVSEPEVNVKVAEGEDISVTKKVYNKESYTGKIKLGTKDAIVTINANTKDKTTVSGKYTVTYSGTVENANIAVSLSGKEFVTGSKVNAADTLNITITPKDGYYFADDKFPKVILKDAKTADLTVAGVIGNDYKASVSNFTANTEITISGVAEAARVKNETDPKENVGAATLDTSSIQAVEGDIKNAFEESDKVTAASAAAVIEALKNEGTIGVSLSVTSSGINLDDKEKGTNAIVSDDKGAKDRAVALNISLTAICRDKNNKEVARVEVNELTREVKITIAATGIFGEKFNETPANGYTRNYFVIRVHDGKIKKIKCQLVDGNIVFSSDLFSTYVFYYEDVKKSTENPPVNPPSGPSGGIGSYVPSGSTSTPAPSATPSATPGVSATPDASAVPSTAPSASPSDTAEPGTSSKPGTTAAPGGKDDDKNTGSNAVKVKVGKKVTINSSKYKVTSVSGTRAVQFTSGKKNAKKIVVPATVKISGKNYKVTSIAKNAFKNNKKLKKVTIGVNVNKIGKAAFKGCKNLKSIIIKTKKLTAKKVGANAFKGINKKATFKVPKKKIKAYKKIVKAKGAAKTVKVKK